MRVNPEKRAVDESCLAPHWAMPNRYTDEEWDAKEDFEESVMAGFIWVKVEVMYDPDTDKAT